MINKDVVIIGAGAAGLMCAIQAGRRGRKVVILEQNKKPCEKIRISGGGHCNFTNTNISSSNYISQNQYFSKSALARFTPYDFIRMIEKHKIQYHEKNQGQFFCNSSSKEIINMLLLECRHSNAEIRTGIRIRRIENNGHFEVALDHEKILASSLVIAAGGLSSPKSGATNFGYKIAEQFGLNIIPPRPGLVPLRLGANTTINFRALSGISLDVEATCNDTTFHDDLLFTHQGVSGPAILQISSFWNPGDFIYINLLPEIDIIDIFKNNLKSKKNLSTILEQLLPSRFVREWLIQHGKSKPINNYTTSELKAIAGALKRWSILPSGTEGYTKAEVTIGGIDTEELSSKTMEAKKVPGLYFVGEVLDVTGWLGGYNLQWAWSSGWAAGTAV